MIIVCSDCRVEWGGQHKPSCHRQGLVTHTSDYRDIPKTPEPCNSTNAGVTITPKAKQ